MSTTVFYMSMSLDGFVAGPNESLLERLHDWALPGGGGQVMSTGAVVAGRGTFEPAGGWGGDHHDGVPIFILTRHDPNEPRQWPWLPT